MVSVLIEEIDMSDAIRESAEYAVEVLEYVAKKSGLTHSDAESCAAQLKAALQSQTAPAVPEEEVQAQALESAWDKLYDMAEDMRNDDPAEASGIMTATEYLREEFTRLRATQQEGNTAGDGEKS